MREAKTSTETLAPEGSDLPWSENHNDEQDSQKESLLNKTSEKIRSASERVSTATSDIAEKAKEHLHSTSQSAKEHYSELRNKVVTRSGNAKKSVTSSFERHPLAYLAGTLAVGVAIGLALPRSRKEKEALSGQGKKIRSAAENVKHEALDAAKAATSAAATTFEEEISDSHSTD